MGYEFISETKIQLKQDKVVLNRSTDCLPTAHDSIRENKQRKVMGHKFWCEDKKQLKLYQIQFNRSTGPLVND